jgi:MraZ protein
LGECGGKWGKLSIFASQNAHDIRMRFYGDIEAKTDQKGRMFLPSVFRKELQAAGEERLVMRMGIHANCIKIYPESSWNRRMDEMFQKADEWDPVEQEVLRMYMQEVERLTIDANGRILIPAKYLKEAEIDTSVRFLGMNDTIEIWASQNVEKPKLDKEEFAAKLKTIMARKQ